MNIFKKDKNLNELLCGKYKHALLQIIFSYSQKYWNDKKIKPYPAEWNEESKEIMIDNNKFEEWLDDNFIIGIDFKVSRKVFEEMLSQRYLTSVRGTYTGFKVIEKAIEDGFFFKTSL